MCRDKIENFPEEEIVYRENIPLNPTTTTNPISIYMGLALHTFKVVCCLYVVVKVVNAIIR